MLSMRHVIDPIYIPPDLQYIVTGDGYQARTKTVATLETLWQGT